MLTLKLIVLMTVNFSIWLFWFYTQDFWASVSFALCAMGSLIFIESVHDELLIKKLKAQVQPWEVWEKAKTLEFFKNKEV
jgi:membrane protein YdbS with pleckstrin-like domain